MRRTTWVNIAIVIALLVVIVGTFTIVGSDAQGSATRDTVVAAKRANVLSTVSATGNVEAQQDLSLSFQQSGEVTSISVGQGDQVVAGQELARVDDTQQQAALASAEASLASAQASLAGTLRGETSAERAQDDAGVNSAQQQVTSARQGLDHANQTAALNASKYQQQIEQSQSSLDQATASQATAQDTETRAESALRTLQRSYDPNASATETAGAAVTRYQLDQAHCQAHSSDPSWTPSDGVTCSQVGNLLSFATGWQSAEAALSQANDGVTTSAQALDQAKQSQVAGLVQDQQSVQNAQSQLDGANASYQSTIAGNNAKQQPAKPEAVAQGHASVTSAEQQVVTAQKNLDDTVLRAPVSGTVAVVNGTVGQQSSAAGGSSSTSSSDSSASSSSTSSSSSSSGFITLTDVDSLIVKAGFTETDAPKLEVGQKATITLDALPDENYVGTVEAIDTNQTVVNNVVTYYATVRFDDGEHDGVKPGMTASVAVVLDKRDAVVTLSTSAVPSSGGTATVTVRNDGTEESRTVTVGLRGDNAVEITDGLAAGEQVIVRSTTSSGSGGFTPPGGGGPGGGLGGGLGGGGGPP